MEDDFFVKMIQMELEDNSTAAIKAKNVEKTTN